MSGSAHSTVLSGARVVLPTGTVANGRIIVDGDRIAGSAHEGARSVDLSGHWIVPGFVDMHNHGGGGASFTSGTAEDVLKESAPTASTAPPPWSPPPSPGTWTNSPGGPGCSPS